MPQHLFTQTSIHTHKFGSVQKLLRFIHSFLCNTAVYRFIIHNHLWVANNIEDFYPRSCTLPFLKAQKPRIDSRIFHFLPQSSAAEIISRSAYESHISAYTPKVFRNIMPCATEGRKNFPLVFLLCHNLIKGICRDLLSCSADYCNFTHFRLLYVFLFLSTDIPKKCCRQ